MLPVSGGEAVSRSASVVDEVFSDDRSVDIWMSGSIMAISQMISVK